MKIDLHMHSNYSDGCLNIKDLAKYAYNKSINVLALTDHDTILGVNEMIKECDKYNINVIPAMELTTTYMGEDCHIISLFKEITPELITFSYELESKRKNRAILMLNRIKDIYNVKIDLDLLENERTITRKNMLANILKCNDLDYDYARTLTSRNSKAYVPFSYLSVEDGINFIHNNGGIAILAHPCLLKRKESILELMNYNFDGIEAIYANEKNDENYFKELASKNHLLISAGSDFHGDKSHSDMGTVSLKEEDLNLILNKLGLKFV